MQFLALEMHFISSGPFSTEVYSLQHCMNTDSVSLEELSRQLFPFLFHKAVKHKLKIQWNQAKHEFKCSIELHHILISQALLIMSHDTLAFWVITMAFLYRTLHKRPHAQKCIKKIIGRDKAWMVYFLNTIPSFTVSWELYSLCIFSNFSVILSCPMIIWACIKLVAFTKSIGQTFHSYFCLLRNITLGFNLNLPPHSFNRWPLVLPVLVELRSNNVLFILSLSYINLYFLQD